MPIAMSTLFSRRRLQVALGAAAVLSLVALLRPASYPDTLARAVLVALVALVVFGVLEQWPKRLPARVSRWAVQIVGVAVSIPPAMAVAYFVTTYDSAVPWYRNELRVTGFKVQVVLGLLIVPWIALIALLEKIKDEARTQALAFRLEKRQLERKALEARLALLQAQVEPHFIFNTLANIRELVISGSPLASHVLDSLIAYLRAAVPRMHGDSTSLSEEFDLARAYLEIMKIRMPDRLTFRLALPPALGAARCPPLSVLTLVENAVRHGIDPGVDGGFIEVVASASGSSVVVEITDDGVGLDNGAAGLGTGLATLRERLHLMFGDAGGLDITSRSPTGVHASLRVPMAVDPT